jgi:hypothetical protein
MGCGAQRKNKQKKMRGFFAALSMTIAKGAALRMTIAKGAALRMTITKGAALRMTISNE